MDQFSAIADARAAIADLANSDNAGSRRFGERVAKYVAGANTGANLLECLGLASVNGETWWQIVARHQRDAALCRLAEFWPDKKVAGQAYEIERVARRYSVSPWLIDRCREAMPAHYKGTMHEFLWAAFSSGGKMPLKKRQIETVLSQKCNMGGVVIASDSPDDGRVTLGEDPNGLTHPATKTGRVA